MEEKYLFLSFKWINEGFFFMCVLKKENFFIKEIFYNLFSLFDLFVKRFLIDSEYDVVLYYLKCFK